MQRFLTKRSIGWIAAGLAVVLATGAYLLAIGADSSSGSEASKPAGAGRSSQSAASRGNSKVRVMTIRPTREHLQRLSTQAAYVEPYEEADLFAKTSGYLEKVHVDIGDRVRKDQVLAELWIPEVEQQRIHKEALVEKAQAERKQAEAAVQAAEALVEAAKATVSEARSQVARYTAEVKFRKIQYDRHLQLFKERALQRDIVDEKSSQFEAAEAAQAAARAAADTTQAKLLVERAKLLQAHAELAGAAARVKVAQADLNHTIVLFELCKNHCALRRSYH